MCVHIFSATNSPFKTKHENMKYHLTFKCAQPSLKTRSAIVHHTPSHPRTRKKNIQFCENFPFVSHNVIHLVAKWIWCEFNALKHSQLHIGASHLEIEFPVCLGLLSSSTAAVAVAEIFIAEMLNVRYDDTERRKRANVFFLFCFGYTPRTVWLTNAKTYATMWCECDDSSAIQT